MTIGGDPARGYAGRPIPWPSSHSVQYVPTPPKHRTRAGLPHLHVIAGNIFAALGAGISWFLAAMTGWPQTLHARRAVTVRWG
jgi:hypothetical protein